MKIYSMLSAKRKQKCHGKNAMIKKMTKFN